MTGCLVDGCNGAHEAKGYCKRHYLRWHRYGDPLAGGPFKVQGSALDRFFAKVDFYGPRSPWVMGRDWVWLGTGNVGGYGQWRTTERLWLAHRWVYEQWVGPIPEGLDLDHLCRNRLCVRPSHLEPVTRGENLQRGYERRRELGLIL